MSSLPPLETLSPPVETSAPPRRKGTLLVVDDEDGPRQSLRVIFKDEYDVLLASDGPSAIALAQNRKIDVAVLDIRMSGMSGIEVLERLKYVDPTIEVVMMTAFETTDTMRQALRLRACDYINKPFDLATMREAMADLGGDPDRINPLAPAEMVIDHSVIADVFGTPESFERNVEIEYQRNKERYQFLRWGQGAFDDFKVVPPGTGIVHQVNIEHLARTVFTRESDGTTVAYPDTCVGTDSHTTMVNGLGVLGWGVGGIEAEAAMLGQPTSMLVPQVVGFRLTGALPEGTTATDLVLTVTEMLRKKGVVGKFVEFFGPGITALPIADRATIANMAPEYGATCGFFPVDAETLRYLTFTGRPEWRVTPAHAPRRCGRRRRA